MDKLKTHELQQSEQIDKIAKALIGFQSEIATLPQGKKGYGYTYCPLDVMLTIIKPLMVKYELAITQLVSESELVTHGAEQHWIIGMNSMLIHSSGQYLRSVSSMPMPVVKGMNLAQAFGSGVSYLRRYSLAALLGLASDEDVDAASQVKIVFGNGDAVSPKMKSKFIEYHNEYGYVPATAETLVEWVKAQK